jgi:hypothetical protein
MTREQLEHVIRAAATIAADREIVVIGSQAVLAQFPNAPGELLISAEADVFPRHHPERADLIDGTIGEESPFHQEFGYYAHGVGEKTATLPAGWNERLVPVPTEAAVGLCLEIHDLVLSKYAAGREKDRDFVRAAIRHGLVDRAVLSARLETMPLSLERCDTIRALIGSDFRSPLDSPMSPPLRRR